MTALKALAEILRKAQGRIDAETKKEIDIGAEVITVRKEIDSQRQRIAELESERDQAEKNFAGAVKDYHKFKQDAERWRAAKAMGWRELVQLVEAEGLTDSGIDAAREK